MHISLQQYSLDHVVYHLRSMHWDLEAEFQRREVWQVRKKQRLIDTILRGWHMPPIHLLKSREYERMTVLDGRQRLAAILDFVKGNFRFNGAIPPFNETTTSLDGISFDQFPFQALRDFNRYTISVVVVEDYSPEEVAELFFRLNQGNRLTAAEHRNAFHGPVGKQIKDIAREFISLSGDDHTLGFSNLRMAYDDVLAHLANTLLEGTLWGRISPSSIAEMYKWEQPLPIDIEFALKDAVHVVAPALRNRNPEIKFGKASIYSWLLFATRANKAKIVPAKSIQYFMLDFEAARQNVYGAIKNKRFFEISSQSLHAQLLAIFTNRCSSRISETSSVVLRDLVIWIFYVLGSKRYRDQSEQPAFLNSVHQVVEILEEYKFVSEDILLEAANAIDWGAPI